MDRHVLQRGALLFLILFAFAIRISGLTAQSLWRDEVDAVRFSDAPLSALVSNFTRPGWNGPLYYVFLRFWMMLVGSSEFAMRYFSLGFGVLAVAMIYRLGRAWCSPVVGALAALLTACSPYMVWYAQEAKMYTLLTVLAIGALYLYREALGRGDPRLWTAVVMLIWVTVGVHVMGALLIPVMTLLVLAWWPVSRRRWRQAGLALAGSVLPGTVALPWILPLLVRGGNIGHHFEPLPGMVTTMLYAFGRGITSAGGQWPTVLAIFALLAATTLWPGTDLLSWFQAVARGQKRCLGAVEGRHCVLGAWVWLAVPILGLYAVTLRVPMFVDRYLIWTGPAFYLLVARGLEMVRRRSAVLAGVCLAAMLMLNSSGVWQQTSTPLKSDFRAAAAYVRRHRQPDELILFHISYVRETFEYYYGDSSPTGDGIPTDEQTTPASVDAAMRERVAGYEVVWLVLSEPEMWDRRGMTVDWLNARTNPEIESDFARVSVIKYHMPQDLP